MRTVCRYENEPKHSCAHGSGEQCDTIEIEDELAPDPDDDNPWSPTWRFGPLFDEAFPVEAGRRTRCAGSDCLIDSFWSEGATKVLCFGCNQIVELYTDGPNLRLRDHLRDV